MSQTILVKGTYRNNITNAVGIHNPKNNTHFDVQDKGELYTKLNICIYPKLDRFKKLEIHVHDDGKEVYHKRVLETIGDTEKTIKDFKDFLTNEVKESYKVLARRSNNE